VSPICGIHLREPGRLTGLDRVGLGNAPLVTSLRFLDF